MKEKRNQLKKGVILCAVCVCVMCFLVLAQAKDAAAAQKTFASTGTSSVKVNNKKGEYIKFKAGVTGTISLTIKTAEKEGFPKGFLNLCNSKKKVIGHEEIFDTNTERWDSYFQKRCYGVKKGQVYYFQVASNGNVKITAKVTEVAKSKANSKDKAKNLKMGAAAKGVLIAGEKTADWYKIILKKDARIKISYSGKTNGLYYERDELTDQTGIKISFCKENGKLWEAQSWDNIILRLESNTMTVYRQKKNDNKKYALKAGTYYIKAEPFDKQASGVYNLKWTTY